MERQLAKLKVAECAKQLGVPYTTIYRRIKAGRLAAVREGRGWHVFVLYVSAGGEEPELVLLPHSALDDILGEFRAAYREG